MISVEDWAEIRRLHRAEGLPIKQIARVMKVSRNTVRAAVRSDGPPRYVRAAKGSVADEFEPGIRELLRAFPQMPSTVIAERVGWPYSVRTLSGRVAELRPAYLPPDPAGDRRSSAQVSINSARLGPFQSSQSSSRSPIIVQCAGRYPGQCALPRPPCFTCRFGR